MARTSEHRPIRWWPAAAIFAVAGALLTWIWLRDTGNTQDKVVPTFPVLFFGVLALFLWFVLFSRARGRVRLAVFATVVLVFAIGFSLFEIEGVDGNLVPIVGFRFEGEPDFGAAAGRGAERAEVATSANDYAQFYGPGRRASLPGPDLARDWTDHPPRELWRREIGEGWSSFAVVGDAAVTLEQRGEDEVLVRYGLRTGEQVWLQAEHAPFATTIGGRGPRATPTIDGGHVFSLGATGLLRCVRLDTGEAVWSRNVLDDHGAELPDWGMASSPLVVDGLVLVQLGNRARGLAAYDRATGEPVWRKGDDTGTYTSPILAEVAGRRQVLVVYRDSVAAHEPAGGDVLWRHEWPSGGERVSVPLVLDDDRVLVSAGYGQGSRMLRVARTDTGFDVELLWESRRLKSKFAPMVHHDGVIYGMDDGVFVAIDPDTGERLWKAGRYGHGQFVLVGDLLLVQAEDGEVVLLEATPEEHRRLATLSALSGKTWNPPALSGRLLLVRNNREAAAYELPAARPGARGPPGPAPPRRRDARRG